MQSMMGTILVPLVRSHGEQGWVSAVSAVNVSVMWKDIVKH